MNSRVRRVFSDAVLSAGLFVAALLILISLDGRVREQVQASLSGSSPAGFAGVAAQARDVAGTVLEALRTQSVDNGPMVILVVAATVLVLAMVRT